MTIEKEARDLCLAIHDESGRQRSGPSCMCKRIAAALQIKQDRIEELEREEQRLRKIIENEGWAIPDGTLRLGLVTAQERIRELESALKEVLDQVTITYESQAEKYLKPEFVGKSRVWSDYGCWLYPGDAIFEVTGEIVDRAKKAIGGGK